MSDLSLDERDEGSELGLSKYPPPDAPGGAFVFRLLHFHRGDYTLTKRLDPEENERFDAASDLVSFVPDQINPRRDLKFGPRHAGFPVNVLLPHIHRSKSGEVFGIVAALYEPDAATLVETVESRSLTYLNKAGGPYTLKVLLRKADASLEALKCKGEKVVAEAAGREFNRAMFQVGLMGIALDEPVSFVEKCGS